MEKGVSHYHRAVARHRGWSLCSCFASTWLDQIRHLHGYSAPHPGPGSRLAEADPAWLVDRSPIWNGAGRPVFGNDHLGTSFSDFVQQSRLGQK